MDKLQRDKANLKQKLQEQVAHASREQSMLVGAQVVCQEVADVSNQLYKVLKQSQESQESVMRLHRRVKEEKDALHTLVCTL